MCILIIYSVIVTISWIFTIWLVVRAHRERDNAARDIERELQASRETVGRVREELSSCRRILAESNEGLDGVISSLREIAKEVEVLESIVNDSNPS